MHFRDKLIYCKKLELEMIEQNQLAYNNNSNLNIKKKINKLICIESATFSGFSQPLNHLEEIWKIGKKSDASIHIDGARLFNAAAFLNVDVKEITKFGSSVMLSLNKALCSPMGAILAGDKNFIERAILIR